MYKRGAMELKKKRGVSKVGGIISLNKKKKMSSLADIRRSGLLSVAPHGYIDRDQNTPVAWRNRNGVGRC